MNYNEFLITLENSAPPDVNAYLNALWYDKNNEWDKAHSIAQDIHNTDGSWIHAYLHRKEGDEWNAQYWYTKANRKMPAISLEKEWEQLARYFLNLH
jgi:hypothetical protein